MNFKDERSHIFLSSSWRAILSALFLSALFLSSYFLPLTLSVQYAQLLASPRLSPAMNLTHQAHPSAVFKVLLTGFEDFRGHTNPSRKLMHHLSELIKESTVDQTRTQIKGLVLPVTYYQAGALLKRELQHYKPDLVISFGLAASSPFIRLETWAQNEDRGLADNLGHSHKGPIIIDGPKRYPSTLPLKEIERQLKEQKIPVEYSKDAGGYICNQLFYLLMHELRQHPHVKGGFIHIPLWPIHLSHPPQTLFTPPNSSTQDPLPNLAHVLQVILTTVISNHKISTTSSD